MSRRVASPLCDCGGGGATLSHQIDIMPVSLPASLEPFKRWVVGEAPPGKWLTQLMWQNREIIPISFLVCEDKRIGKDVLDCARGIASFH